MYDMTIELRQNSEKCLYEQIYEHIRQEIREGKLLTGEKLPSTRSLAEYLQVARSTVDVAYDQLVSEGYIESRPYRGYFVCPVEEIEGLYEGPGETGNLVSVSHAKDRDIRDKIAETDRVNRKKEEPLIEYDFSPHGIDMTGFPFGVWKRISKNILTDSNAELFSRGEPQGDYDLRTTISRYLHSSRGVNCTPEQIIVGAGNDYLLMLLEKILGRHVQVAMENPTYMRTYRIFQSFAYPIETVAMDEGGMMVSELEKSEAKVAYVMPSHQYPTGVVMPIGRRMELLNWANKEEGRFLIEDDYDSEFRYRGKPIPSLQSSDKHEKVIYIGTFSKAIAPAIRVGYMVLPLPLLKKYRENCSFFSCTVSRIDQKILNEFIRNGYFERHLNKMRKIYRDKHDLLLEELQPFAEKFELKGEHAGLHVLLVSKESVSEEDLILRAVKKGVRVYGMSENCVTQKPEKATVLLGFGDRKEQTLREGIAKLKEAWL